MIMRLTHLTVMAALIVAAAFVYKIKFESTVRAAELTRLAAEIRRERDAIAALRGEWAMLDNPARIQGLAERHLPLRMLDPSQIDRFEHLPERPPPPPGQPTDAIAAMIDTLDEQDGVPPAPRAPAPAPAEDAAGAAR
jgi:hypothetical protein